MERGRCEDCLFWDASQRADVDWDTGVCRRSPPGFDDRTGIAVWPFTEDTDWCGEFKPDPALSAAEDLARRNIDAEG